MGRKTTVGQIPVLNTCQMQLEDPTQKDNANQFKEDFTNIGKPVTKNLPAMNPVLPDSVVHSMFPEKTSCAEVTSILRRYRDIEKSGIEIGQFAILGAVQEIGNYKLF